MITCYDIIESFVKTEKTASMEESGQYVFKVGIQSNKIQIKNAVEEIYKVKVKSVHTSIVRGKLKRMRRFQGSTTPWKKAVVFLKDGQKIEVT